MPMLPAYKPAKSIRGTTPLSNTIPTPDSAIMGHAIIDGLHYLKNRLGWSGTQIAHILHLPPTTLNTWLKNKTAPINSPTLPPDIQAILHLLAIHRSLEAMFENPTHQQAWLTTLHPAFNAIPLAIMSKSIDGLIFIRQYLDYTRGRGA